MNSRKTIRILVECAIMIALGTALSFVQIVKLPYGGSVTLVSMLPVCLIAVRHGNRVGLAAAFCYALIQMMIDLPGAVSWGLSPLVFTAMLLLDYLLAFTALGFAGTFRKLGLPGILCGVGLALAGRFLCHFASGVVLWGDYAADYGFSNPWIYSLAYNGSFMGLEIVFTLIAAAALFPIKPIRALLTPDGPKDGKAEPETDPDDTDDLSE